MPLTFWNAWVNTLMQTFTCMHNYRHKHHVLANHDYNVLRCKSVFSLQRKPYLLTCCRPQHHTYVFTSVYTQVHAHMHAFIPRYVLTWARKNMYVCLSPCVGAHIHTVVNSGTHAYPQLRSVYAACTNVHKPSRMIDPIHTYENSC